MSFVSDQRGWALGTASCGAQRCDALLGTADGGATWAPLTAPARWSPGADGVCPASGTCAGQIRFATPLIGYAYDPSLFMTTDGGRTWQPGGAGISSLEAADGTVVRVASDDRGCAGAPAEVDIAAVGGTAWRPLPAPPIPAICPPVLYRQGERLVLAGYGNPAGGVRATALIARSADGGQAWTAAGPDRCGGADGYASAVALAPPDVLVLICQHQADTSVASRRAWLRVSVDGGASFGPDQAVPCGPHPGVVSERYQLAAASAGTLLITQTEDGPVEHASRVLLTEDGGRSWSATLSLPAAAPVLLVGYEDPLTGRIAQGGLVWTTRDGGRTWAAGRF